MKIITRAILPFQENTFFAAIRDKIDYANLLVHASRNLLIDYDTTGQVITSNLKLVIDKMSRLFLYTDNKFFSVSFPFTTTIDGSKVNNIQTYSGKIVNSHSISSVIAILANAQFKLNPSPIEHYMDSNSSESIGLSLLEEIFQFEPSYIRFDTDRANENGKLHPLHHLDVNYSSYGTFKFGLNNTISESYFEDVLNITKDCAFLAD
ncbi:MAG: hypothetical protein ACTHM5_16235 [Ginsengibacter sp.]